jgi:hypothetical protein
MDRSINFRGIAGSAGNIMQVRAPARLPHAP